MTNRLPELGDRVKCKVTGFTGIVTAHAMHIAGCDRLWVDPPIGSDGKMNDGKWFDIDMLSIVDPLAVERIKYDRKAPGGIDLPAPR